MRNLLVTGGAGFIGSNFIHRTLTERPEVRIFNLDALTYAGSLENLRDLPDPERHIFVQGDICNRALVDRLLHEYNIDTIVHFAAESHVDRSILGPGQFVQTNIIGTFTLLEAARQAWLIEKRLPIDQVRFHHVSTDEVFGSLARRPVVAHRLEEAPGGGGVLDDAEADRDAVVVVGLVPDVAQTHRHDLGDEPLGAAAEA